MRTLLGFVILSCAFGQTPAPLGDLVDVGGGQRVHLYCLGEGSPAVVVSGGYSVDWALVQPEVAKFTRICTYDTAATAWSDAPPVKGCMGRVTELHAVLAKAAVKGPVVLVGFSVGGLVTRFYARQFPDEVAGMVFVDHAFTPKKVVEPTGSEAPVLVFQTPITFTAEETSDFKKLPVKMQELHRWAEARRPVVEQAAVADDCLSQLPATATLGNIPVAVVSTANEAPGYAELQTELMRLSKRSYQLKAERSFHSVEIDQPEAVVRAIRRVFEEAK